MKEWLLELWTSKSAFRAFVRVGVSLAGVIVTQIPDVPTWIGLAIMAAANVISAGERNVTRREPTSRSVD